MKVAGKTIQGTVLKKLHSFSRDMTAANGTATISGIGFQPDTIIFWAHLPNTTAFSWAIHDQSFGSALDVIDVSAAGSDANSWSNAGTSIYLTPAGGKVQSGVVSSVNSDGYVVTWTKTGSPSAGTGIIYALAIKW